MNKENENPMNIMDLLIGLSAISALAGKSKDVKQKDGPDKAASTGEIARALYTIKDVLDEQNAIIANLVTALTDDDDDYEVI